MPSPTTLPNPSKWNRVNRIACSAVVFITTSVHLHFDTACQDTHISTGFVVDAKRGIIMTNRHVMTTAPSTHTAKFFNGDWVQLAPWYYDPLHDYAFFKYEPSMLKTKPIEIELAPEKARRNTEFMVVGNDNGEKLSSAVGHLDDVMRGPPEYSSNGLELVDVNTVYYTSLTMNSRGSSGAPVLDVDGKALAIVGGGSSSSQHIMMLPLHQAKKTLAILQDGELPPRGTIQAVLVRKEPSELERIGFPVDEVIAMSGEFRKEKGLLQIESIVPRGPAFQKLMQGDVLALADGKPVSDFDALTDILDSCVGQSITIVAYRDNQQFEVSVSVHNLFQLNPTQLVKIGYGHPDTFSTTILHEVSLNTASVKCLPVEGIMVADANRLFAHARISRGDIITHINRKPTRTMSELLDILPKLRESESILFTTISMDAPTKPHTSVLPHWSTGFPMDLMTRDRASGYWSTTRILPETSSSILEQQPSVIPGRLPQQYAHLNRAHSSIVKVAFTSIAPVSLHHTRLHGGYGFVASKEHGLVVCDKVAVPTTVGEVMIIVADTISIPATAAYIDPASCFVVLKYDVSLLTPDAVEEAMFYNFDQRSKPVPGDTVFLLSKVDRFTTAVHETRISARCPISMDQIDPERRHILNTEDIVPTDATPSPNSILMCNTSGDVCGFWTRYSRSDSCGEGFTTLFLSDVSTVAPIINALKKGAHPVRATFNAEFSPISLLDARAYGLSTARIAELMVNGDSRMVFAVARTGTRVELTVDPNGTVDDSLLRVDDIVLKLDGKYVHSISEIAVFYDQMPASLLILRDGQEVALTKPTLKIHPADMPDKVVFWSGMCIRELTEEIRSHGNWPTSGVYLGRITAAAPANHIHRPQVITCVNGISIDNIDDFVLVIKRTVGKAAVERFARDMTGPPPQQLVRIQLVDERGNVSNQHITLDGYHYPAMMIKTDSNGKWVQEML